MNFEEELKRIIKNLPPDDIDDSKELSDDVTALFNKWEDRLPPQKLYVFILTNIFINLFMVAPSEDQAFEIMEISSKVGKKIADSVQKNE